MREVAPITASIFIGTMGLFFFKALIFMLLWNSIITEIFNLSLITFWQAVGLKLIIGMFAKIDLSRQEKD